MTIETNGPGEKPDLAELDDDRLRKAVVVVRESAIPEEALSRALDRADHLTSVAAAVRRQPTTLKPAGRRFGRMVIAVGVIWIVAAGVWSASDGQSRLRQIGLALHNYDEGRQYAADASRAAGSPAVVTDHSKSMSIADRRDTRIVSDAFADDDPTAFRSPSETTAGTSNTFGDGDGIFDLNSNFVLADGAVRFVADNINYSANVAGDAGVQKKMVHAADVALVVKELAKAETQLAELVQKHHAEIATSQVAQSQGQQRAARWIIRVPADGIDALLKDLAGLGITENRAMRSQDVTTEYIDLETQIANKKKLEQRILDILEKKTGDIKDVLAVEEQLSRIRTEVDSMEGRKRYLDSVTKMATINVSAREEAEYVPPEVKSFSNQTVHVWRDSLGLIENFGKSLVLVAVAVGPWLPIIGILGFVLVRMVRRRRAAKG